MTPPPPAETDGPSLPPRHRPNKDSLASDTTERGFWDLDDLTDDPPVSPALAKIEPRRNFSVSDSEPPAAAQKSNDSVPVLPSKNTFNRRMSGVEKFMSSRDAKAAVEPEAEPEVEAESEARTEAPRPFTPHGGNAMESDFDDLERWESPPVRPTTQRPAEALVAEVAETRELPPQAEPAPTPAVSPVPAEPLPPEPADAPAGWNAPAASSDFSDDEFVPVGDPNAKPFSLRPLLKLTRLEMICMACLGLALVAGGVWTYQHTLKRIGRSDASHGQADYPVRGSHLTVTKLVSYWRQPLATETVRRGVVLIPVVELTVSGGPGAIRVVFANEHGKETGDLITRAVNGEATLVIPATDGFEDVSMHAAYRADLSKPWLLQISEAPSAGATRAEFKPLLNEPISPEKR